MHGHFREGVRHRIAAEDFIAGVREGEVKRELHERFFHRFSVVVVDFAPIRRLLILDVVARLEPSNLVLLKRSF